MSQEIVSPGTETELDWPPSACRKEAVMNKAVLCVIAAAILPMCGAAVQKSRDYSYSLSVAGHSVVVSVLSNGKTFLVVDGTMSKKDDQGQPRAVVGKAHMVVGKAFHHLAFWINQGDRVVIRVRSRKDTPKPPRTADKLYVGKKLVTREKSVIGDVETPVTVYDFTYQLISGELVYDVTQSPPSKSMTDEFRAAVKTLKPRRVRK